jgi:hypothetical protein
MSESLGLTSTARAAGCSAPGSASTAPRRWRRRSLSPAPKSSPPSRARVPAARRSSCTSPRRQSAGARRSRHVGRDSPWRTWCEMPRAALGVAAGARCAQHTADNCHVEIVCAASARVNVSVFYQFVDTAKWPWPSSVVPRRGFPVGQRVARSLPERWPAVRSRG